MAWKLTASGTPQAAVRGSAASLATRVSRATRRVVLRVLTVGSDLVRQSLVAPSLAAALTTAVATAQSYPLHTYDESDGLANAFVADVAQARNGLLWILTRGGLESYDGTQWQRRVLLSDNAGIVHLTLDDRDVPWFVTWSGRLSSFEDGAQQEFITNDSYRYDGRFAIAWNRFGGESTIACVTALGGLRLSNGDAWETPFGKGSHPDLAARGIVPWRDRFLLVAGGGLQTLEHDRTLRDVSRELGLPEGVVLAACWEAGVDPRTPDRSFDGLWVVADRWLGVVRDGRCETLATLDERLSESPTGFMRAAASRAAGLFFGNELFGMRLAPGATRPTPFEAKQGLPGDGIQSLTFDREQNLWIGQSFGLSRLRDLRFRHFARADGLAEDETTALLELDDDVFVVGHARSLSLLDHGRIRTRSLPDAAFAIDAFPRVMGLRSDRADGYFVALWKGGVLHVDVNGQETFVPSSTFGLENVTDVDVDESERIWIAGFPGTTAVDRKTWQPIAGTQSPATMARRLYRDRAGTLYAATAWNGVLEWRDDRWVERLAETQRELQDTWCVFEARDGRLWVGTRQGVALLTERGLVPGPTELSDAVGPIYAITETADGHLWFGTDDGLIEWNDRILRRLSSEHGLLGREVNRAAFYVDAHERIWVGTARGLSVGALDDTTPQRTPPVVEVLALEVDGVVHDPTATFELGAEPHVLVARARAVSFVDERKVGFRWRLAGFDSTWSQSEGSTVFRTRYTNLPPGTYTFEITARAFGGEWAEVTRSSPFVVHAPLWRRTWFLVLVGASVLGLGWFVQQAFVQRRYARALASEVEARTRELSSSRLEVVREKERLHATLESIGDGVVAVDADGRVALVNGAAERLLGSRATEIVGVRIETLLRVEREDGAPFDTSRLRAVDTREPWVGVDLRLSPARGEAVPIELAVAPLAHGDVRSGAVLVLRDLSERRRLEREIARADRLRSLGILAGGIAHDFNNVLTAVGGRVTLIELAADSPAEVRAHAEAADKALTRARDLAHQLLTFARGGEPVRTSLSIVEVLDDACQLAFSGSRVRVVREIASNPSAVEVDRTQVQQVFENLLINARQSMPNGGRVFVRVQDVQAGRRQHPALEDGPFVRIEIEDEGQGIAPEHLQHVFDPFFTTKPGGSGLGLSTAYSVVQRHGGAITVRSRVGAGTCFAVYLPVSRRAAEPRSPDPRGTPRIDARILIVDDEPDVRAVLAAMLERMGAKTTCVDDEDVAVARWREARERDEPFDFGFLDLTIPGGAGGIAVARRVLDVDPGAKLIAMSGYASDPVLAHPTRYGFRSTLAKPFRMHDVGRALGLAAAAADVRDGSRGVR
ncbi:MAG: ATP-binding protein [Planctomycetes bacterium]|nr:ATP-binding protein [Planctomycetota bacterium]